MVNVELQVSSDFAICVEFVEFSIESTITGSTSIQIPILIILIGGILLIFLGMNALFSRFKLPPLIGYILLGWLVQFVGNQFNLLTDHVDFSFNLLAKIGVILLLFHIGIESKLTKLLEIIGKAGFISICEIFVSGALAFVVAYLFGFNLVTSLIIGVSLTATSLGVSTSSWSEKDLYEKSEGPLLLDLASLDDILGILLFSLLFGLIGTGAIQEGRIFLDVLVFLVKITVFIGICYLFSHFAEQKIMTELIQYEKMPDSMLSIMGIGLVIAGIAALIQFSLVVGAFFAGIAFSRDPRAVKMDASMKSLLDFFVPFFFFWIGFQINLFSLSGSWIFLIVLFFIAIGGKIIGVWLPGRLVKMGSAGALLLSVSMIPRAEVTMVIMQQGLELNLLSHQVYSVVALVVLATCFLAPFLVKKMMSAS